MEEKEEEAPKEETEAPKEETEAPKEETEAPKEETETPKEETEAPKEETEAPKDETEAPKEETVAPKEAAAEGGANGDVEKKAEEPKAEGMIIRQSPHTLRLSELEIAAGHCIWSFFRNGHSNLLC